MKTTFTLSELKSIVIYMKRLKNEYVIDINEIKKDKKTGVIFSWFGLVVLLALILLLRFNFFKNFVEQDEWYIYINIAFLWGCAQITIMNRNFAVKTAKRYISLYQETQENSLKN